MKYYLIYAHLDGSDFLSFDTEKEVLNQYTKVVNENPYDNWVIEPTIIFGDLKEVEPLKVEIKHKFK